MKEKRRECMADTVTSTLVFKDERGEEKRPTTTKEEEEEKKDFHWPR